VEPSGPQTDYLGVWCWNGLSSGPEPSWRHTNRDNSTGPLTYRTGVLINGTLGAPPTSITWTPDTDNPYATGCNPSVGRFGTVLFVCLLYSATAASNSGSFIHRSNVLGTTPMGSRRLFDVAVGQQGAATCQSGILRSAAGVAHLVSVRYTSASPVTGSLRCAHADTTSEPGGFLQSFRTGPM
jgi:hypothetical protein